MVAVTVAPGCRTAGTNRALLWRRSPGPVRTRWRGRHAATPGASSTVLAARWGWHRGCAARYLRRWMGRKTPAVVLTVHAADGVHLAEQRRAPISRVVKCNMRDQPPRPAPTAQMPQAFYMGKTARRARPTPPLSGHLEEGDAAGGEVLRRRSRSRATFSQHSSGCAAATGGASCRASAPPGHGRASARYGNCTTSQMFLVTEPERPVVGWSKRWRKSGRIQRTFRRRSKLAIYPPAVLADAALPIDAAPAIRHALVGIRRSRYKSCNSPRPTSPMSQADLLDQDPYSSSWAACSR